MYEPKYTSIWFGIPKQNYIDSFKIKIYIMLMVSELLLFLHYKCFPKQIYESKRRRKQKNGKQWAHWGQSFIFLIWLIFLRYYKLVLFFFSPFFKIWFLFHYFFQGSVKFIKQLWVTEKKNWIIDSSKLISLS